MKHLLELLIIFLILFEAESAKFLAQNFPLLSTSTSKKLLPILPQELWNEFPIKNFTLIPLEHPKKFTQKAPPKNVEISFNNNLSTSMGFLRQPEECLTSCEVGQNWVPNNSLQKFATSSYCCENSGTFLALVSTSFLALFLRVFLLKNVFC